MNGFKEFLLYDDIQSVLDEVDLHLEREEVFRHLFEAAVQGKSYRNERMRRDTVIDPLTKKPWRATDIWRQFEKIVSHEIKVKGTDPKKIWVTFSEVPKLGQRAYVSSSKSTPVGIFAFPLAFARVQKDGLPFSNRPYMHIFKTEKRHFEAGGESGDPAEITFGKIKNPFVKSDHNDVITFGNDLTLASNKLQADMFDWTEEKLGGSEEQISALRTEIANWAGTIKSQVRDSVRAYDNTDWKQKSAQIHQQCPWLNEPAQAVSQVVDKGKNPDAARENLKKHILSLKGYAGGDRVLKYSKVDDDLSVYVNPEYSEALKRTGAIKVIYLDSYPNLKKAVADPSHPVPFKEIYTMDLENDDDGSRAHQLYSVAVILNGKGRGVVEKRLTEYINQLRKIVDGYGQRNNSGEQDMDKLPYRKKLQSVADELGLDFPDAIHAAFKSNRTVYTPNQYLYRAAEALANQLTVKSGGRWQMAWNTVLRKLGISGLADTKHSGHVHGSEPTQGVFMDPRDITHIATIIQTTHSDQNHPSNRPGKDDWSYGGGQHNRTLFPRNQRWGGIDLSGEAGFKNMNSQERLKLGIKTRFQSVVANTINNMSSVGESEPTLNQDLVNLIKLTKSYNRLKPSAGRHDAEFRFHLNNVVKKLERLIKDSPYPDVGVRQKAQYLSSLAQDPAVKVPIMDSPEGGQPRKEKKRTPDGWGSL